MGDLPKNIGFVEGWQERLKSVLELVGGYSGAGIGIFGVDLTSDRINER